LETINNGSGYGTINRQWIFLFQNLLDHTTSHDAARIVNLSFKWRHPSSVADMFQVWCANGFQFTFQLGNLC